jgi:CubicO group peptidase (beta-lactamase class C family)
MQKDRIQQTIAPLLAPFKHDHIGFGVEVIHRGELAFSEYGGYANREHCVAVTRDTVFPVSSMSKTFTAMIIMQLAGTHQLDYQDPVRDILPELPNYAGDVKIRHLLEHSSGLLDPYGYYYDRKLRWYDLTNQDIWNLLTEQAALRFPAGSQFEYCNANYVLLAMIAETVLQQSFGQILHSQIFQPLGMDQSALHDARYVIANRAYGYRKDHNGYRTEDIQWLTYGDGGILSSLRDLFLWDQAFYTDQLISQTAISQAFTADGLAEGESKYQFGWNVHNVHGHTVMTQYGGDPGFGTNIGRVPEQGCSLIAWANIHDQFQLFQDLFWKILPVLLEEEEER